MSGAGIAAPPMKPAPSRVRGAPGGQASAAASTATPTKGARAATSDGRRGNRPSPMDPLSDRATLMLIRRVLCPQKLGDKARDVVPPIEELLPSLTSRNDVDLQLYAFLAIIMREFVQSWYNKVTPDETFVAEILQIIAHCTRGLEQRFRKLDVESLLLDEIPDLLDRHVTAYRASHSPVAQEPVQVNPREVYHSLCPLPQLSPVPNPEDPASVSLQLENEAAYRQLLVQAILAILLPTEDLENPCLTALVGQIFSELIIGNIIANKAAQPWLLYESICIAGRVLSEKKTRAAQRIVSSSQQAAQVDVKGTAKIKWSAQAVFLSLVHLAVLIFSSIRTLITMLAASSSLPPRSRPSAGDATATDTSEKRQQQPEERHPRATKVPVLAFKFWQCVGNIIELDFRMPWLSGFLSLVQYQAIYGPGKVARLNGSIDRLLSHQIQQLLSISHLPPLLRTLRGVLFPNNNPGKPSLFPPSSEEELEALRQRAAASLLALLPSGVRKVYFGRGHPGAWQLGTGDGGGDEDAHKMRVVDDMKGLLAVLDDEYCNKHLMYSVLELVLVRLLPELSDKGVVELWEERLG